MKKVKKRKHPHRSKRRVIEDKILVLLPYAVNFFLFTVVAFFFGKYVDSKIFAECYGRDSEQTVILFTFFAASLACSFTWFFQKPLYKMIIKDRNYDMFQLTVGAELLSRTKQKGYYKELRIVYSVMSIFFLVVTFIFVIFGCFNGAAINNDGDIVYKSTAFSHKQIIDFETVEIVELTNDNSWNYAFKLDNKWQGYSAKEDSQAEKIMIDNIKKYDKNVRIYESIKDIEQ